MPHIVTLSTDPHQHALVRACNNLAGRFLRIKNPVLREVYAQTIDELLMSHAEGAHLVLDPLFEQPFVDVLQACGQRIDGPLTYPE